MTNVRRICFYSHLFAICCYWNFQSLKRYCSKRICYCINLNAPRKLSFTNFSLVFRWNDVRWVFNGTETITLQGPKIKQKKSKNFLKIWWLATIALLVLKLNKKNLKMFLDIQWLATIALLVLDVFYIWFITDPKLIYALPSTLQCFQ